MKAAMKLLIIEDFVLWGVRTAFKGPALKEEMWGLFMKDSHDQLIALQERKLQSQEDGARDWELEATEVARVEQAGTAMWVGNEDSLIVEQVWNRMPEKI